MERDSAKYRADCYVSRRLLCIAPIAVYRDDAVYCDDAVYRENAAYNNDAVYCDDTKQSDGATP